MQREKYYITTPIYYVNDIAHVGHAYTTIAADILARFYRMKLGADNVFFLTGTDEHGAKIAQSAAKAGKTPQEFTDELSAKFQMLWDELNISNNNFIRTTDPKHEEVVKDFVLKMKSAKTPKGNDALYEDEYEGLYCVGCESYKKETDLVEGKCPDHKTAPVLLKEKNWFFRLEDYKEKIRELIEKGEMKIEPELRKNEVLGLLDAMENIAISRKNLEWGIRIPFDSVQTLYVWIDALINYLSGTDADKFWPADVHLVGKDIIKFHTVIWPAMLLSVGYGAPKKVFAHGYFTINGEKMSKTIGNVINPQEMVDKFGTDATRYLIISQFPFGQDGDIAKDKFEEKYTADLCNGLGNLVSRVLSMIEKYFNSEIDVAKRDKSFKFDYKKYSTNFSDLKLEENIQMIKNLVKECDMYITEKKPWEIVTKDEKEVQKVLASLLEQIINLSWLVYPYMPDTAESILSQINLEKEFFEKNFKDLEKGKVFFSDKIKVSKGQVLFPRIVE